MIRRLALFILLTVFLIQPYYGYSSSEASDSKSVANHQSSPAAYLPMVAKSAIVNRESIFGALMPFLNASNGLDLMTLAHSYWAPRDLYWKNLQPAEGTMNWAGVADREQEFLTAVRAGYNVILILDQTPDWALKPGFACGAVAQDKLAAMGDVLYEIVARYSAPPYNIRYYQISNEPDAAGIIGCWGDVNDAYYGGGYYGEMLKVVYPRIKAANPNAQVLVGGLLLDCDPVNTPGQCTGDFEYKARSSRFFEGILRANAGNSFDGVTFHAYDYYTGPGTFNNGNWNTDNTTNGPSLNVKAAFLRSVMDQYGVTGKYLMNTEVALLCGSVGNEPPCLEDALQQTKSAYVVQSYVGAMASGLKANVWFYAVGGWRASGLINDSLQPNPAYYAYQFSAVMLGKASFVKKVVVPGNNFFVYEFTNGGMKIWVIWSVDGQPGTFSFSEMPVALFDMQGSPLGASTERTIDWKPVFAVFRQ